MRTLLLAAALAALAGSAAAQLPTPAELIARWDKNGDGAVDKAEWVAAGRQADRFAPVDTNKDGKITAAELEAAMAAMRQRGG